MRLIQVVLIAGLTAMLVAGYGQAADLMSINQKVGESKISMGGVLRPANMNDPIADESAKANKFFEEAFIEMLLRKPMLQSYLGIKKDYDKWDDFSDEEAREDLELIEGQLDTLCQTICYCRLDAQTKISYDLFVHNARRQINSFEYRHHNYPVNQVDGMQSLIPSFLVNIHLITSPDDAKAYISRLQGIQPLFRQVIENLKIRAEKGIVAPKFVFPYVLDDCRHVLKGAPFEKSSDDSTLLADFKAKVNGLDLIERRKSSLIEKARAALLDSVGPSYRELIDYLTELEKEATTDDGVWKFPDGQAFYDLALRNSTTTSLSADEVYEIGLKEVSRIQEQMKAIMDTVEFDGSLQEFFTFMREDKQFYYEGTEEGRKAYYDKMVAIVEAMKERLDELFLTKPAIDIVVRPVEAFREQSAEKAFYQPPALDGSRPGIFYINLYRVPEMPTYQMEALAYHEGIPGHHMQFATFLELECMPTFRKIIDYTAYIEGWALYAELIPKEIGFYEDPYSDFGRLATELWRACRLVVDTGLHAKKWTRQQAIDYLMSNTPNTEGEAVQSVERYIVMPAQATAYTIGLLKILELREMAQGELGEKFDLREFHKVVLQNGPMPLTNLEKLINAWIGSS